MESLFKRLLDIRDKHPEAMSKACEIVQRVQPSGERIYLLPTDRKLQLTCEIAEALVFAHARSHEREDPHDRHSPHGYVPRSDLSFS